MFLVCDPVCWGLELVPVNAAILEVIRHAFPSQEMVFCGEESHLNHLRSELSADVCRSITWKSIPIPPRHATFLERSYGDLNLLWRLFKMLKTDPGSHLVLNAITPSTLMALKILLCCTFYRFYRAQIILHGGLASLNGCFSRNPVRRIQDLRTALRFGSNRNLQYILLEEPIRMALLRLLPSLQDHVVLLEHPIPTNEEPKGNVEFGVPLRIGFLGMTTEAKGFRLFLEVASAMVAKFPGRVEFHAIGWTEEKWESSEISPLATKPRTKKLPRPEYIRQVESLHFVCLPYQGQHYELSPSGALLDAVAWEKPVITSRIPMMENLVSRFGDIGYLCADKHEFCDTIEGIIKRADVHQYRNQVSSMREVRRSRTPQYLASTYRDLHAKLLS
jgi:hypothetical protein